MKPQVMIVGAGPVGLTMAGELTRYGVSVRIVDKEAHRTDKSKALVLWSRTLELLDRGAGSEAFIAAGQKVDAANIIAGDKLIAHVSLTGVKCRYPYGLMLPQSETERLLEDYLTHLGINVERQVEATGFTSNESSVTTTLHHADGREESVESEWLLGCDGARSMVRHSLGLSFLGDTLQSDWILADIHLKGYPFPETELAIYWHAEGVLAVFPISPGRFRVIGDVAVTDLVHPPEPTLDQVQALITQRGPSGLIASDPIWLSAFRVNERKVGDYRAGRVFLAGDAAHIHSPAGGQGMNTGMQDAFNLAWKLALVCHKTCPEGLLDSYSAERSAVGEKVLKAAGRLTAIAMLRNHTAQAVRNFVGHLMFGLAPVRAGFVNSMTELSIGYEHSPLNGPSVRGISGPSAGERMAPIVDQVPIGSGKSPRFALFCEPSEGALHVLDKFGELLEPATRPPLDPHGVWLVRPDGYVACVAKIDGMETVTTYIDAIS